MANQNEINERFLQWWNGSKYMQVVISSDAMRQCAKDAWDAALAQPMQAAAPVSFANLTPLLYTDVVNEKQVCRDDMWMVSTAQLKALAALPSQPAAQPMTDEQIEKLWIHYASNSDWMVRRIVREFACALLRTARTQDKPVSTAGTKGEE